MRPLPEVVPETEEFWRGGRAGRLRIKRCATCDRLWHPSFTVCPVTHDELEWIDASGSATVIGCTVNVQQFLPDPAPPYVVALVALDDDPRVRLVTNVVDAEADAVNVGLRVSVQFEEHGDVWLPMFAPMDDGDDPTIAEAAEPALPQVEVRPMARAEKFEDKVAITGIGMSEVGRRLMRAPLTLTVDAALAAIADAGLTVADIDGLATWPGGVGGGASGNSEGGIQVVENALGVHATWHNGGMETPGHSGALVAAMLAVASGLCRHVLVFRTVWEATATELMRTGRVQPPSGGRIAGDFQWRIPFGASSAANWIALYASQYFHRFGASREMLGWIAINARTNAARNPNAIYTDPMTMDDYLAARVISTPFGLYDCDIPCDGAIALVVSAADAAVDAPKPVRVEAVGTQITETVSWDQGTVTHEPMVFGPAAHLWTRTDLKRADVDVAEIYDGFTFNCVSWLEALGFCEIGETAAFVEGGARIALDGELPLNTHGGQLSAGRTQGFGFLHEAVVQLRGDAGERQVDGAEVAVVATGGGLPGGALLLTRPR